MRITPLDLRNHRFRRRIGGYASDEVDEFLRLVAEDYEAALREVQEQRELVIRLDQRVEELASNEQVLQDTLTTAQKLSEDLKRTAIKEAEVVVGEAEIKAEKILDAAHRRAAKLAEDIREMKRLRLDLTASLRATIERHLVLLEHLATEPVAEDAALEQRISVLTQGAPRAQK